MKPNTMKDYRFLSDTELLANVVRESYFREFEIDRVNINNVLSTLTPVKRAFAEAIIEIYKRGLTSELRQVRCSTDIYKVMHPVIGTAEVEEGWAIALNQSGKIIGKERVSVGGIAGTVMDVRVILKKMLLLNATQVALGHNHPSGHLSPSNEDKAVTAALKKATDTMNIRLIDHVIIGKNGYYSFADEGLI